MFRNHAIRMQVIRTNGNENADATDSVRTLELEELIPIIERQTKQIAVAIVAVYTAIKVVSTASEIAVNMAPKHCPHTHIRKAPK